MGGGWLTIFMLVTKILLGDKEPHQPTSVCHLPVIVDSQGKDCHIHSIHHRSHFPVDLVQRKKETDEITDDWDKSNLRTNQQKFFAHDESLTGKVCTMSIVTSHNILIVHEVNHTSRSTKHYLRHKPSDLNGNRMAKGLPSHRSCSS